MHRAVYGTPIELDSKAFPNILSLFKRVIWLETKTEDVIDSVHSILEGFYPRSSPLLFIQISSEARGVWFPVIGLMTFICFATV